MDNFSAVGLVFHLIFNTNFHGHLIPDATMRDPRLVVDHPLGVLLIDYRLDVGLYCIRIMSINLYKIRKEKTTANENESDRGEVVKRLVKGSSINSYGVGPTAN